MQHEGTSLWWYSIARNKKSITLDLRDPRAPELIARLVSRATSSSKLSPSRLEEWGLDYGTLSRDHPA